MRKKYPIIKIPAKLEEIIEADTLPASEKPKAPKPPKKPDLKDTDIFPLGYFGVLISMFLFVGLTMSDGEGYSVAIYILIFSVVIILINTSRKSSIKESNQKKKKKYDKHLKEYKKKKKWYDERLEKYSNLYDAYIQDKSLYRKELVLDFLNYPNKYRESEAGTNSNNHEGLIEQYIYKYFDQHFPGKIIKDGALIYDISSGDAFYPDLIYRDSQTNLKIDIEIDEPYVGDSGKPIHYGSSDHRRDSFFNEERWVVIRFTERQAFLHPESCCKEMARLIARILPGFDSMALFTTIKDLPTEESWSRQDSINMAKSRYRESYLSDYYSKKLSQYDYSLSDFENQDTLPF